MHRIINWFRSWWVGASISRELSATKRRMRLAEEAKQQSEARLKAIRDESLAIHKRLEGELATADRVYRQYDQTLDELRAKLQVAEEVTIPGLTAASELTRNELEAYTAIATRRQVSAIPHGVE